MSTLALQLLICLYTAHVLGDFVFQTNRVARRKHEPAVLVGHVLTVATLSYVLCGIWSSWFIPAAVFVAHGLIDAAKARLGGGGVTPFLVDQAAHAASIVLVGLVVAGMEVEPSWVRLFGEPYFQVLVVVAGLVVVLRAGGVLIGLAVEPLLSELEEAASSNGGISTESRGLRHGGRLIGQLERALIFLFVLNGQPASIGFLIAAKSIFRFGELRDSHHRMEAEYIIIGTMMSFGFGLLIAYAARYLLSLSWT